MVEEKKKNWKKQQQQIKLLPPDKFVAGFTKQILIKLLLSDLDIKWKLFENNNNSNSNNKINYNIFYQLK